MIPYRTFLVTVVHYYAYSTLHYLTYSFDFFDTPSMQILNLAMYHILTI